MAASMLSGLLSVTSVYQRLKCNVRSPVGSQSLSTALMRCALS
jgi:hypothetical protein